MINDNLAKLYRKYSQSFESNGNPSPSIDDTLSALDESTVSVTDDGEAVTATELKEEVEAEHNEIVTEVIEQQEELGEAVATLESLYLLTYQQLQLGGMSNATKHAINIGLESVATKLPEAISLTSISLESDENSFLGKIGDMLSSVMRSIKNGFAKFWTGLKRVFKGWRSLAVMVRKDMTKLKENLVDGNTGEKDVKLSKKIMNWMVVDNGLAYGDTYLEYFHKTADAVCNVFKNLRDSASIHLTVNTYLNKLSFRPDSTHTLGEGYVNFVLAVHNSLDFQYLQGNFGDEEIQRTPAYLGEWCFESKAPTKQYIEAYIKEGKNPLTTNMVKYKTSYGKYVDLARLAITEGASAAVSSAQQGDILTKTIGGVIATSTGKEFKDEQRNSRWDESLLTSTTLGIVYYNLNKSQYGPIKQLSQQAIGEVCDRGIEMITEIINSIDYLDTTGALAEKFGNEIVREIDDDTYGKAGKYGTLDNVNYARHIFASWLYKMFNFHAQLFKVVTNVTLAAYDYCRFSNFK